MTQLLKDNHHYQLIEDTILGGMKLPKGLWIKIEYHNDLISKLVSYLLSFTIKLYIIMIILNTPIT